MYVLRLDVSAARNPNDVRHGEGQYFSDISPGTKTVTQLSRVFLGQPFRPEKFTHYVEVDVAGLPVFAGGVNVFVNHNTGPLDVSGRVIDFGRN